MDFWTVFAIVYGVVVLGALVFWHRLQKRMRANHHQLTADLERAHQARMKSLMSSHEALLDALKPARERLYIITEEDEPAWS